MTQKRDLEILVVDDEEGHRELVRRNLRRAGISNPIIPLSSGREILDYIYREGLYAERPAAHLMVLLDINMPGGIDGIDVLRRLKADPQRRSIPVVILTTTDDPREVERCYALGCNVYMTKPVEPAAFIDSVSKLGLFISIVNVPAEPQEAS